MTFYNLVFILAVVHVCIHVSSSMTVTPSSTSPAELDNTLRRKDRSKTKCDFDVDLLKADCSNLGLTKVPSDLPVNIRKLFLSNNQIQEIHNDSFVRYPYLVDIFLKQNHIHHIDSGAFFPLRYLKSVNLIGNELVDLPSHLYIRNFEMTDIFLRDNRLKAIPDLDLRAHLKLSMIDLGNNNIESVLFTMVLPANCQLLLIDLSENNIKQIKERDLDNLRVCGNISSMDFTSNIIESVDMHCFQGLNLSGVRFQDNPLKEGGVLDITSAVAKVASMRYLSLENTSFSHLTPDIFSPLENSRLTQLALGANNIKVIPDGVFHHLTRIEILSLVGNPIKSISPAMLSNVSELRELYLEDCRLTTLKSLAGTGKWPPLLSTLSLSNNYLNEIPHKAFVGLENLRYLILQYNSVRVIHPDSFYGLTNLEVLRLNNNNLITTLTSSVFSPLQNLITLDLSESSISSMNPQKTFSGLLSLQELYMEGNHFHLSSIWESETNTSTFQDMHNLKYLDLSSTNLNTKIPPGCFRGLHNIRHLNLQAATIAELHPDLFEELSGLQILSLDDNAINKLPQGIFRNQTAMTSLFLSGNTLSELDNDVFEHTIHLSQLTLSGTNIDVINKETLAPVLHSLISLDLSHKTLSCSCQNEWLRNWMDNSTITILLDGTTCSKDSPENLQGKQFLDFDPVTYCGPRIALYTLIAVLSVVLIVCFVFIYYNRWWINHKCFLLKLCVIGYKELIDDEDYEYNVNIVFHDTDGEWVTERLVPNIQERDPNLVLCIGDDELPLGMYRLDAVVKVIDDSYKSVFVVSKASIKDSWFLTKLRLALQHVNYAKRDSVLFVFLENIADEDLPYLVRILLSVNRPYLQWDDNPRSQEYFWRAFMKSVNITVKIDFTIPV